MVDEVDSEPKEFVDLESEVDYLVEKGQLQTAIDKLLKDRKWMRRQMEYKAWFKDPKFLVPACIVVFLAGYGFGEFTYRKYHQISKWLEKPMPPAKIYAEDFEK